MYAPLDSSPEPEEMTKSKTGVTRGRTQGFAKATMAAEQKRKRAATAAGEPKERVATETTVKLFPLAVSTGEPEHLKAGRSLPEDLEIRISEKEIPPAPVTFEHVLH